MSELLQPQATALEVPQEQGLRPKTLSEYIGQESIKKNLDIFISAARKRKDPLEHVLLYGSAGLGKTTLAHVIAHEMNANIRVTSGPAIEKSGDLAAILSSLQEGDILFVDEIHRLNRNIEEVLYPAMEDFALDIIIGKGPSAKTIRLALPPFTLIGATTKISSLSSPLRDRFGNILHLDFYNHEDITKIITRSSKILSIPIQNDAAEAVASRSRRTPRVANRLLKRVRDMAQVHDKENIDNQTVEDTMKILGIDLLGLDAIDRLLLRTIIEKYKGGPVGLGTLSAATGEEIRTIEEVYEPYLLQLGFLNRTPKGREVTHMAREHLGLGGQKALL
ncbi:MAG: holliday junction DNA helicase RuvB [Parcubacteria group bacterium Gr01-1014_18]|nr:MAG: holliday junction DNA helicase RuvB [Parcubacteria group bacterium Greene0416_36]TSC79775.1 MAG: holliday junction DNA helicase RuvB [Parcubacteria group bacterium Gr01-1014_18]TSC97977.1 MAG: holliday junction DNA helicase RuvB [Parcubacteria group bacterium Greene1014_20]TSD06606.1 MAG: holliday junction DNA helicase RuvB [Parcubacteria group bacterium Greene0714_2]